MYIHIKERKKDRMNCSKDKKEGGTERRQHNKKNRTMMQINEQGKRKRRTETG
jgi:hypothetical protein